MERDYIDLLELLAMVREELEAAFPERFWVKAEIASVQTKANGHCYLELVQHENGGVVAKVKANIWRSRFAPLRAYFREATGGDLAGAPISAKRRGATWPSGWRCCCGCR